MNLHIGDRAPDFSLPDQNNTMHHLKDYLGNYVVLYFYPKDDTPGCTLEACSFRDALPDFKLVDTPVIGISADSVQSHGTFHKKFNLSFVLLSDESKKILEAYGVWGEKRFMGKKYVGISRTTFIIDPQGMIAQIYNRVKPIGHARAILKDLAILKEKAD